jgi:hypothetical protein
MIEDMPGAIDARYRGRERKGGLCGSLWSAQPSVQMFRERLGWGDGATGRTLERTWRERWADVRAGG